MLALITAKLCSPWSWPRQLTYFAEHNGPTCRKKKYSLRAGFEPAREDPIGFQVQRLNHSAITAHETFAILNGLHSFPYYFGKLRSRGKG